MDTLHDRLARLSEAAPTGGAAPSELWARGTRTRRIRSAGLVAALLVIMGSVGAAIGVPLVDGDDSRPSLASPGPVIALPIEYPVGEELPDLGDAPGPLAAIWASRLGGSAPRAVGLVAATGTFGTLPIDAFHEGEDPGAGGDTAIALSPDGRRIAYQTPTLELVVRDLVSGERVTPSFGFRIRPGFTWVDGTHLVGHVVEGGNESEGWVWHPGAAPERVDLYTYPGSAWLGPHAGRDPWFIVDVDEDGGRPCSSPPSPTGPGSNVPLLCDVLGVIGSQVVLTHWNSDVVALDRADFPFQDPALRRVVVTAGAPERVTFATALIAEALRGSGGES